MKTVAIVGVGLIGGSFALALRKAGFAGRILGVSSERTLREALALGIVDEGASLREAAGRADLIYLAQPILRILESVDALGPLAGERCLVTDAGSTKAEIVERGTKSLGAVRFLGGHPMAGKEVRGCGASDPSLFQGRTWVLTPFHPEQMELPSVVEFRRWIELMGAVPLVLGPAEHDAIVAFTSHLPQLASTALAAALHEKLGASRALLAAGPGLLDTTRLALSSYELWADILATNRLPVEEALDALLNALKSMRRELNGPAVEAAFSHAAGFAAAIRKNQ